MVHAFEESFWQSLTDEYHALENLPNLAEVQMELHQPSHCELSDADEVSLRLACGYRALGRFGALIQGHTGNKTGPLWMYTDVRAKECDTSGMQAPYANGSRKTSTLLVSSIAMPKQEPSCIALCCRSNSETRRTSIIKILRGHSGPVIWQP